MSIQEAADWWDDHLAKGAPPIEPEIIYKANVTFSPDVVLYERPVWFPAVGDDRATKDRKRRAYWTEVRDTLLKLTGNKK